MNLERIRQRLKAAMKRRGAPHAWVVMRWATGAPDPLPASEDGTLIALPGETTEATLERHGVTTDADNPSPVISLTLNGPRAGVAARQYPIP